MLIVNKKPLSAGLMMARRRAKEPKIRGDIDMPHAKVEEGSPSRMMGKEWKEQMAKAEHRRKMLKKHGARDVGDPI